MTEAQDPALQAHGLHAPCSSEVQALLAGIAAGSQVSLAELYDLTSRQVFSLAHRILKDSHAAEEVVLDVFLQIWKSAASFDPARGRALGWMLTIARSRSLDALRSRTVRSAREEDLRRESPRVDGAIQPCEGAAQADVSKRVATALAELPPEQARALELAYFQGLSHTEIAAILGLSLGTIKTRIRLGMLKLREKLKTFEDAQ